MWGVSQVGLRAQGRAGPKGVGAHLVLVLVLIVVVIVIIIIIVVVVVVVIVVVVAAICRRSATVFGVGVATIAGALLSGRCVVVWLRVYVLL